MCLRLALIVGVLVGPLGNPAGTRAAEGEATDDPLLRRIPAMGDGLKEMDPFFRDTELNLHPRIYYFYQQNTDGPFSQAWACGGWLEYKSGWLWDIAQIGATLFGTGPIFAPANEGGTNLLTPDQEGFAVAGIAYGALRYQQYAILTGYRQFVDTPYINRWDNRMVPQTSEAVTVGGKLGFVEYFGAISGRSNSVTQTSSLISPRRPASPA